eukprot:5770640-Amphidinium_carterae.1
MSGAVLMMAMVLLIALTAVFRESKLEPIPSLSPWINGHLCSNWQRMIVYESLAECTSQIAYALCMTAVVAKSVTLTSNVILAYLTLLDELTKKATIKCRHQWTSGTNFGDLCSAEYEAQFPVEHRRALNTVFCNAPVQGYVAM